MNRLTELLERIGDMENELVQELSNRQEELLFTIEKRKILFSEEVQKQHEMLVTRFSDYVFDSGLLIILTVPIIWLALIPALFLDGVVSLYQLLCFPIYGIPRVKRRDHVVIDRHELHYLNWLEKINCAYCGYFNGLMGYVREVAARTEQYWCPVRHARPLKSVHSRYKTFFEYGDAKGYRQRLNEVRKQYEDVE